MFRRPSFLLISLLAGCTQMQTPMPDSTGDLVCEPPRPQVCTMIYDPVCAVYEDGAEETLASACNACADEAVTAYRRGNCDDIGP